MGATVASSLFGALGLALSVAPAAAADARYEVAAGCPARDVWVERVAARLPETPDVRVAIERLAVHIEPVAGGYRGWVRSREPGADAGERSVQGRACEDVLEALVLIAALSLEGGANGTSGESLASIVVPAELSEPELDGLGDRGAPEAAAALPRASDLRFGALGFAQVQSGAAPQLGADLGAALVASWRTAHFDPWLLLGAYAGWTPQLLRVGGATARFEHWAARAEGCPWRFPRQGALALRPCIGLDVGRSSGEGAGVARAALRSAPWLSGLGELRLDVELADRVMLGAAGGATLPFVRPRFYFEPGVVAYHAASVGFAASSFAALLF